MSGKTLLILCFLGDPMLPAVSVPNTGGYNVDIKELLDFLAGTDWNCVVVTNTSVYLQERETSWASNIKIYRIPVEDAYINEQDYLESIFPRVLEEVTELCLSLAPHPDLIHSHYWFSGFLAQHLSARLGIPFIHSVVSLSMDKINSGIKPRSRIQTMWEQAFLPHAKAIFTITAQECDLLLQYYPVSPERVLVVGRSVAKEFIQPQHDAEGFPTGIIVPDTQRLKVASSALPSTTLWWNGGAYLFMGRLREIKGIDLIIRAWFQLYRFYRDRVPPLWIVGGDPEAISSLREQLKETIPDLSQAEQHYKLIWWGYLSPAGISTLLLKSAVLIMHSRFEAGGRIVLEAMSSRKPVIATPTGFAKDYITDWKNGFLVDYGDTDTLVQKMELFIRQPLLSNAMGNNAYQTFLQMESQWDCYARHLRVYRQVCQHPEQTIPERLRSLPELEPITDFVKGGLLTAYPYQAPDISLTEHRLSRFAPGQCRPLKGDAHSNLWQIQDAGKACVVKQFYSVMSEYALWADNDSSPVLLASEQYKRAIFSSCVEGIIPILKADPELFLILMPQRERLATPERRYADILGLLSRIGAHPHYEETPTYPLGEPVSFATLSGRWEAIAKAADMGLCAQWNSFWRERKGLADYQDLAATGTPSYCICYGASVLRHLCADETRQIFLYPGDHLFLGESGFDQARLWLEWEWTYGGNTPNLDSRIRYELARSHTSLQTGRFKNWCVCLVCQGILRSFRLGTDEADRLIRYLQFLLEDGGLS